jgi:hypothetical protein
MALMARDSGMTLGAAPGKIRRIYRRLDVFEREKRRLSVLDLSVIQTTLEALASSSSRRTAAGRA